MFAGARVYLACRSVERGENAAKSIQERTGVQTDRVPVMQIDLSSMKSVKNFVYDFKRRMYKGGLSFIHVINIV